MDNLEKTGGIKRREFFKYLGLLALGFSLGLVSCGIGSNEKKDGTSTGAELPPISSECIEAIPQQYRERVRSILQKDIAYLEHIQKNSISREIFSHPHLLSLIYCTNRYRTELCESPKSPNDWIYREIMSHMRAEDYIRISDYCRLVYRNNGPETPEIARPLRVYDFGTPETWEDNHPNAVDLFASEGSEITSVSAGVVILAEDTWSKGDVLSTSSYRGGNSVIVYYPGSENHGGVFFRYAHMDEVHVRAGSVIQAGAELGTVGRTGENAAEQRSPTHLHLEMHAVEFIGNNIDGQPEYKVVARNEDQIMRKLESIE